jgi:3'(2'), 5'-bisphosphate nucleotidase
MDLKNHLATAILAAEEASKGILEIYHSDNFDVEAKGDQSPLTKADKKAHGIINVILEATNLPVLSEEGRNIPIEERKDWEYFWMVDPLDGTKEFIKRNGEFTVNIALIHKSTPVLGVVTVPVTGDVFYASNGNGAFLKTDGQTSALPKRKSADLRQPGLRVVASRSHMNEETQNFISSLEVPELVSKGSSLKFMLVAEGKADIYPRYAPTMEWDTAAAHAIINEIGLQVVQFGRNAELKYNKSDLLNPYFLVK